MRHSTPRPLTLRIATLALISACLLASASAQQNNSIATVAGGAAISTATQTAIPNPTGVAEDANGNIYVASQYSYYVYQVNPATGAFQPIAGTGIFGYSGDNGPATQAGFADLAAVAVDKSGNVYVIDGNRIRVINMQSSPIPILGVTIPSGWINTVAGAAPDGKGESCADPTNPPTTSPVCGDGGPALQATFFAPQALYVDGSGNIFVADTSDERIRVINTQPNAITVAGFAIPAGSINTVAGNGWTCNGPGVTCGDGGPSTAPGEQATSGAKLDLPQGVVTDSQGNIYIGDTRDQRIRCVANTTAGCPNTQYPTPIRIGTITTYAGLGSPICESGTDNCGDGGPKSQARFHNPAGLGMDATGDLYIADQWDNKVREVLAAGTVESVCGTGTPGFVNGNCLHQTKSPVEFYGPLAVIVDSAGNMTVADSGNSLVRQVPLSTGVTTNIAGSGTVGDGGPATLASLANPDDVKWDPTGTNYYIVDNGNNRIREVNGNTSVISTVVGTGQPSQAGSLPPSPALQATLNNPNGIAVDANGILYIADSTNSVVRAVNTQSTTVTITGIPIAPGNIAIIAGQASSECEHLEDPCGDGGPATLGQMDYPVAVAVDVQGNVYISDYYDNKIRCVNNQVGGCNDMTGKPVGTIFTYAGTGDYGWNMNKAQTPIPATKAKLYKPYQIGVQGLGDLDLADSVNDEIRCVAGSDGGCAPNSQQGYIYWTALNHVAGCSGDGGTATAAMENVPQGLALDPAGNLYFGGGGDFAVRRVDVNSQNIMSVAGSCTGNPGFGGDGGASTAAQLSNLGMSISGAEELLIADQGNNRVRQVDMVPVVAQFQMKLNFGDVNDGTTSAPMTATMQNYGLATLPISSTQIQGMDAQYFNIVPGGNTCVNQLPPGPTTGNFKSTCSVQVTFSPVNPGSYSATLVVNTSLGAFSWTLLGTGQ